MDSQFGGRYIGEASSTLLRSVWLTMAAPVWTSALVLERSVHRFWRERSAS